MADISKWDYWRSYVQDVHLESISSDVNGDLDLWLVKGQLQLCASTAIYSFGLKYLNYLKSFELIDLDALPGFEILSLGFGLGSIPTILEKKFGKVFQYTGVELDEEILLLANEYVVPDLVSNCILIHADAYQFIRLNTQQYAMITMDVFLDAEVPSQFEELEFLALLKEALQPGGILLYNRMSHTEQQKMTTNRFLQRNFKKIFPSAVAIKLDGNTMLFSDDQLFKRRKRNAHY